MRAWALSLTLLLSGCGSRSGLLVPEPSEAPADAGTQPNPLCAGAAKNQLVTLLDGEMQPAHVAVSGESLVVAEWPFGGDVFRMPRTGGKITKVLASDEPAVNHLVADAQATYWVVQGLGNTDGALHSTESVQLGGLTRPQGVTLFGGYVYFTDGIGPPNDAGNGRVQRLKRGGANPALLASGLADPWSIAVDASGVYFTDGGTLFSLPHEGGKPTPLAGGFGFPEHLTSDGQHLFWSDGAGSVYRRDHATGLVTQVGSNLGQVEDIAADAAGAYLVSRESPSDTATGRVLAIHDSGLQLLAKSDWAPFGLALDVSSIYVVAVHGSSGRVSLLCRPQ